MSKGFRGWSVVAKNLQNIAHDATLNLNLGQKDSVFALADRLESNGIIIADEVGMGKTRIAVAAAQAVINAGGRVAVLVPPGLGFQWQAELKLLGIKTPPLLRSLWQYLQAWECNENPAPWHEEQAVLISHAFSHWRLGEQSKAWRWALLPELYAQWSKYQNQRYPRGYHDNESLQNAYVKNAAKNIVESISKKPSQHPQYKILQGIVENNSWKGTWNAEEYSKSSSNDQLRYHLQQAVGLGLGEYDLVIIDEAHKSRKEESSLSQLLEIILLQSSNARRLAMTATPIELNPDQWTHILKRIGVDEASVSIAIKDYSAAVQQVKTQLSELQSRSNYKTASIAFKKALTPYLLRRDKRGDASVIAFKNNSGLPFHNYREEKEICVETGSLTPAWKQAVCAAEALSFVSTLAQDSQAKRLRLSMGNGHGIANLLDQIHINQTDDQHQLDSDAAEGTAVINLTTTGQPGNKRMQRAIWWKNILTQPLAQASSGEEALYDHPAILAAVAEIEIVYAQGEKVLLFGRFTRPLKALVNLVNARAMLKHLDAGVLWPQTTVIDSEWPAVVAAHRQLHRPGRLNKKRLNAQLAQQYQKLEQQRRRFRDNLLNNIEAGFNLQPASKQVQALFNTFKKQVQAEHIHHDDNPLALVARAIQELTDEHEASSDPKQLARCFEDLVDAATDRDQATAMDATQHDEEHISNLWSDVREKLKDEYSSKQGGFARLMNGGTQPNTRRFLQMAFNRKHGHPQVLVAQSMVGREGLNLHQACRTVILLHPEWNPGVVEQQIGRIDRIGSLWEKKLAQAIKDNAQPSDLPKIRIRPIIFKGTYDEKNWLILHERWDDLRAQLHGVVISANLAEKYINGANLADEINASAPTFHP